MTLKFRAKLAESSNSHHPATGSVNHRKYSPAAPPPRGWRDRTPAYYLALPLDRAILNAVGRLFFVATRTLGYVPGQPGTSARGYYYGVDTFSTTPS
jgi:hypothetical protein